MGYAEPLKLVNRRVGEHILVSSCPFQVVGKFDLGGRMVSFNYEKDKIILWSALPYGEAVIQAWQELTGLKQDKFDVTHLVVVNFEHNMVAQSYKEAFPNVKIIGSEKVRNVSLDIPLSAASGGTILTKPALEALGITDKDFVDNIELMYLNNHKNKEVVLFEKNQKVLCVGDTIFNHGSGPSEQYCEATGYPKGGPFTGWSIILNYLNPGSVFGRRIMKRVTKVSIAESFKDLQKLYETWDFKQIEVLHGNAITSDAKEVFRHCLGLTKASS